MIFCDKTIKTCFYWALYGRIISFFVVDKQELTGWHCLIKCFIELNYKCTAIISILSSVKSEIHLEKPYDQKSNMLLKSLITKFFTLASRDASILSICMNILTKKNRIRLFLAYFKGFGRFDSKQTNFSAISEHSMDSRGKRKHFIWSSNLSNPISFMLLMCFALRNYISMIVLETILTTAISHTNMLIVDLHRKK